MDNEKLLSMIEQEIAADSSLSEPRRRRMLRRLKRRRVKQAILDHCVSEAIGAGLIEIAIAPTGAGYQPLVNWDELLAFIKELIPIIIELIGLFS